MTPAPPAADRLAFVVEDDESIAHLLRFMLQRSGYRVQLAADGREAQALIESGDIPAIMLCDVMLPYRDGVELVQLARAQPAWAQVPIFMLTAKTQQRDIDRALAAGADDYIEKPFQPADLIRRLQALPR